MPTMWRGPSAELRAAYADPLHSAVWKRCGRFHIGGLHFHLYPAGGADGRRCQAARLVRQGGEFVRHDLDIFEGRDPIDTALKIARAYTPFDAELIAQWSEYLMRQAERLIWLARDEAKLCAAIDELIEAIRDGA